MQIDTLVVGEFQVNCLVVREASGRALIVDPGAEADVIGAHLEANALTVAAYVLTHGHCDHISALPALLQTWPAPVSLHAHDRAWAFTPTNVFPPFYNAVPAPVPPPRDLEDGRRYGDGELAFRVVATPGHTPGSVCLHFEDAGVLLAGDTLFAGSVGRSDLPGGDARVLRQSLRRLAALPDVTRVYPGHGPATTLAREKTDNFFMQGLAP